MSSLYRLSDATAGSPTSVFTRFRAATGDEPYYASNKNQNYYNSSMLSQETMREELKVRASKPMSSTPRPFIKWVGSKRFHLQHIVDILPTNFGTYWEPFLGAG